MTDTGLLEFDRHGATLVRGAAGPVLPALEEALSGLPRDHAGLRLHSIAALSDLFTHDSLLTTLVADRLGKQPRAVRAILFDKNPATNWALGWHQDRTIAVMERHDTPGYGPWTLKAGMHHVEPPFALLESMLTMRIHLDPVPHDNAPLLIAPGSHRLGRIPENAIAATVARCGTATCLAARGDVWLYATPILHASDAARCNARRRVLQLDFSADALPAPLRWLGV